MLRTVVTRGKIFSGSVRSLSTSSFHNKERSFSHVQLLGRVGNDPKEVGSSVRKTVLFNVAVDHVVKSRQAEEEGEMIPNRVITNWHTVTIHRPGLQDYVISNVIRGSRVLCTGKLENRYLRSNPDEERGQKVTNIILDDIILLNTPQRNVDDIDSIDESMSPFDNN